MSWSSPLRVLGVCGLWLAVQTGCGGNPSVSNTDKPVNGGTDSGGSGATTSTGGTQPDLVTGGDNTGEGGTGAQPNSYVCGNGMLEPGEFCDDGNTDDDDGCSGDCQDVNLDYDCSKVGEPCVLVVICGNGVLEGDEACDDGNTDDDDGCAGDCSVVEAGYECVRPGKECVKVSVCGNGIRERGEVCDDGDLLRGDMTLKNGDGCDDKCQNEDPDVWYCQKPGDPCVKQVCGDGVRTPGEICDDHNDVGGDGCSADCKVVEPGWHCNAMGCKPECGDGLVVMGEACDDGNPNGGDGCSSACTVEPYFKCNNAEPSVCSHDTKCGNNVLDPIFTGNVITGWEVCDPPGMDGCKADCKGFDPVTADPAVCGNGKTEAGETCDRGAANDPGCVNCQVKSGWACPPFGACSLIPVCGDSTVDFQLNETCDPPNVGKGCSAACKVEAGWTCVGLGPSVCVKPVCGNSIIEPGEECDDGTATGAADGCLGCVIGAGYVCPAAGQSCQPRCGDGAKLGIEQCDDGNLVSGDGCNAGCKIEPGFKCPTPNQKCVAAVCGDKILDAGEGCDDGGLCFGGSNDGTACTKDATCTGGGTCKTVAGDGCGPTCQPEPTVTVGPTPTVNVFCGDGLKTGTEVCDDGNKTDGDGCQGDCKSTTPGWTCPSKLTLPPSLQMQVTYRDFKQRSSNNGNPDFEHDNAPSEANNIAGPACKLNDTQCLAAAGATCGAGTCGWLDAQGKPVFHLANDTAEVTNPNTYSLWYRDTNPTNIAGDHGAIQISKLTGSLTLNQVGGAASEVYEYASANFFPLTGLAFGNDGNAQNFHFTTELRYFFQYKGGETLTFRGDDDVWVFINGRLAVDVGGVHCAELGQVVLGDEDSSCTQTRADFTNNTPGGNFDINACATTGDPPACGLSAGEQAGTTDNRFGLTKGGVYEIVLFHAERHTSQSNFRLTLAGFLPPRSSCSTFCGDGIVAGDEFCDDGAANSNTVSGACNTSCTARNFCGDKVKQTPGEACDDGANITLYKTAQTPANACAPGCMLPAFCGDGSLQAGFGEKCDLGTAKNTGGYNGCTSTCQLGGYCGDGIPQAPNEACDNGVNNGKTYGDDSCGYDCQAGPRCGDGQVAKGFEACDDGAANGTAGSHCGVDCTIQPYCGDGIKAVGEECDYGKLASTDYGGCTDMCTFGPHCGDGGPNITPDPEEECDLGTAGNVGGYDGCKSNCTLGPRCGDGIKQANEKCDNGFNADDYNDPNTVEIECGPGCQDVPRCGDAMVQSAYELCDNGTDPNDPNRNNDTTYNGCTTKCVFGPFCGDGKIQTPDESCDDGAGNVGYRAAEGGCSYDCQPAPWCGDGERNGPEQCDLGADKNTGDYGTCKADCTFAPRCGDKVKDANEECDDGPAGSLKCTVLCKRRDVVQ